MPIAEACTLVDASLEHEACSCTGRGAEARTYAPLVSRVVITLIAASLGDGLLHLGLASASASCTSTSSHGTSKRRDLKPCEQCFSAYTAPLLETHTPLNAHLQRGHNKTSISRIRSYVPKTVTLRFNTNSGAVMHNNANYQHR